MSKARTKASEQADREQRAHQRITVAYRFVEKTGLCAVCRKAPAKRATCGSEECVRGWLFPAQQRKKQPPAEAPGIRALTLKQPWAWYIVRPDVTGRAARAALVESGEIKLVENRSWSPPASLVGGFLAIHAGKTDDYPDPDWLAARGIAPAPPPEQLDHGAIVGVARLVRVVEDEESLPETQRRWWIGTFGWVLADVVPIEPLPCLGKQGLWGLDELLQEVRRRYAAHVMDERC